MPPESATTVFTSLALLVALVAGGRGGDRVPAEVSRCYETRDGAEVPVFRCVGGSEGGVRPLLDPFLVFDVYRVPPGGTPIRGFPAHAHRGFIEIRYLLAGALSHQDSCGNRGRTLPGGAQLFHAGRGAAHEENVTRHSALLVDEKMGSVSSAPFDFEGFQVWLNLPAGRKNERPSHRIVQHDAVPTVRISDVKAHNAPPTYTPPPAGEVKVLSGTYGGVHGPLSADTPGLLMLDVARLQPRAQQPVVIAIPDEQQHALLYVYRGSVLVEVEADPSASAVVDEGEFAPLTPGISVRLRAGEGPDGLTIPASCLLLTAPRIREPVFVGSGFAMHSRQALDAAVDDLRNGRAARCGGDV